MVGKFQATLRYDNKEIKEDVFVIKGLRQPLVGRPAIASLNLLIRVESVNNSSVMCKETVTKQFSKLFSGLGTLKGPYQIKLTPNALFELTTPCRVPIPLLPKVKAELQRMECKGVISRIKEPTPWCSGMVVVPKGDGSVRIYVDLTKLLYVERDIYFLLSNNY